MTRFLLDCDPGHDDAVAILYAARRLDLLALTTVFGNQSVEWTTRNALSICRLAGLRMPVARGAAHPLVAARIDGSAVHGSTGLDGAELPEPDRAEASQSAVELIVETARAHRGELVIVATGAMTNVALALSLEPKLAGWLKGISIMGGSAGVGNVTPVAEFNIYCDPEAADIVFRAGVPLWMVGLDITRQVGVSAEQIADLRGGGPVSRTIGDLLAFFLDSLRRVHGLETASLHDPCALVPFVAPDLIDYRETAVQIELASPLTRGMTLCDLRSFGTAPLGHVRPQLRPNTRLARQVRSRELTADILGTIRAWDDARS